MEYKRSIDVAVTRNREFWTGGPSDAVLAKIEVEGHSAFDLWMEVLAPGICPDAGQMLRLFEENFRFRACLDDDAIPTARPSFGSSVYGAFFGADVRFGSTGPYARPLLNRIGDFRSLRYDFEGEWLARQLDATRRFVDAGRGRFGVSIVETMDNLNLAENLRGSGVYLELLDSPRDVLAFFDLALGFNVELVERQRETIEPYQDGYFDIHEIWVPDRTVWISIDAWNLVAPGLFRRLGLPHIQRFIDHFGSAWLHMHNQGLHLIEDVLTLKGLVGIGLIDDPTEPRCFPRLQQIQAAAKGMPLQINCSCEELLEGIRAKRLPRNVMYWVDSGVPSLERADRIMEMVRNY